MTPQTFEATLEQDTDGTWRYVHVHKDVRDSYKRYEKRGIIHASLTVGNTTWDGSMLPWADGSAQISIPKKVRDKEKLALGDSLTITIHPR